MKILSLIIFFTFYVLSQTENDKTPSSILEFEKTTPSQDSAFQKAKNENIPNFLRFKESLINLEFNTYIKQKFRRNKWLSAKQNLEEIPLSYYDAIPQEIVNRQADIANSQYVPHINPFPSGGFQIPLSLIGAYFGLVEDTNPVIDYNLDYSSEIEVVVYSVQAVVVATIFKGKQFAGNYTKNWNGRDDVGKRMPPGDYIIEVRIGKDKYIRKRVKI